MTQEVRVPYTPFGDLKEGDEFIRLAGHPVLLRDIAGEKVGPLFYPSGFGQGRAFRVDRMVRMPGGSLAERDILEDVAGVKAGDRVRVSDDLGQALERLGFDQDAGDIARRLAGTTQEVKAVWIDMFEPGRRKPIFVTVDLCVEVPLECCTRIEKGEEAGK